MKIFNWQFTIQLLTFFLFVKFKAMKSLHGAEIYGVRLKVLEAEEQGDTRKRSKMDMN